VEQRERGRAARCEKRQSISWSKMDTVGSAHFVQFDTVPVVVSVLFHDEHIPVMYCAARVATHMTYLNNHVLERRQAVATRESRWGWSLYKQTMGSVER
jgi:hypothetical protein